MAGIFPNSGTAAASSALNTVEPTSLVAGCTAIYYSTSSCTPRFDPSAANAVMAELINVFNAAGHTYDCGSLDNLATSIQTLARTATAATGTAIVNGETVLSDDGRAFINATGADVTPVTGVSSTNLVDLGLTAINNIQFTQTTSPTNAVLGDRWYDTNTGRRYIYWNDGTSNLWIETQ